MAFCRVLLVPELWFLARGQECGAQTKYVTTKVWLRHLHYTHNILGEPPPVAVKNKKKVVTIDEVQKE